MPGVVATEVGYSQGVPENPTYEDVCAGDTGHNEVVQARVHINPPIADLGRSCKCLSVSVAYCVRAYGSAAGDL